MQHWANQTGQSLQANNCATQIAAGVGNNLALAAVQQPQTIYATPNPSSLGAGSDLYQPAAPTVVSMQVDMGDLAGILQQVHQQYAKPLPTGVHSANIQPTAQVVTVNQMNPNNGLIGVPAGQLQASARPSFLAWLFNGGLLK